MGNLQRQTIYSRTKLVNSRSHRCLIEVLVNNGKNELIQHVHSSSNWLSRCSSLRDLNKKEPLVCLETHESLQNIVFIPQVTWHVKMFCRGGGEDQDTDGESGCGCVSFCVFCIVIRGGFLTISTSLPVPSAVSYPSFQSSLLLPRSTPLSYSLTGRVPQEPSHGWDCH